MTIGRIRLRSRAAAVAGALLMSGGVPACVELSDTAEPPKNVIVLIGDGMGHSQVAQASVYETGAAYKQVVGDPVSGEVREITGRPTQTQERFPVQVEMQTFPAGGSYDPERAWTDLDYVMRGPTDSAAAGTAMATGHKTTNAAIGLDASGNEVENISERAISLGKAAGVVTSVPFSHATPAAYVAHDQSRGNYHAIADDELASELSVVLGAGHPFYDDSHRRLHAAEYEYISAESFEALSSGATDWTYLEERAELEGLATGETPERVFGIAQVGSTLQQSRAGSAEEPYGDPLNDVPDLAALAAGALNVLDEDPDGFSLMVEGGAIDWAGHDNDSVRNIEETLEFHEAVDTVVEWVVEHSSWDETLVIVTADHETGYLRAAGSGRVWRELAGAEGAVPDVSWNSGDHTNMLVPVYAKGAGAERLTRAADRTDPVRGKYLDNTDLANILLKDLWATGRASTD